MPVEVDALCNLATCDREKDSPATAIARALEVVESKGGLNDILGLNEEELVL